MATKTIIFEQPLNEQIRLCLRLEYLFAQATYYLSKKSLWDLRQAVTTILELLQIADRPDLKNKLGQALNQYAATLAQAEKTTTTNKKELAVTLKQINQLIDELRANTHKPGQELRNNEFLMALQQRLYTPAGTCEFSLPSYHLWLKQDKAAIHQQLAAWLTAFQQLHEIANLMLKLTRSSTSGKTVTATGGFYQSNLDHTIHYQMIRIKIAVEKSLFPEISVGRHRLAIHFFTISIDGRIAQTPADIPFELACCKF